MQNHQLKFRRLDGRFAVCRLPADAKFPEWALVGAFTSVTRSADEFSIVCLESGVPPDVQAERPWVGFKLEGPFPFSQTGILASFISPLAESAVPIFALSTYDTDYVFVKEGYAGVALSALQAAGHQLLGG